MVSGEWLEKRVTRTPDTLSACNKTFPYTILSTILASGALCSEEFLWPPRWFAMRDGVSSDRFSQFQCRSRKVVRKRCHVSVKRPDHGGEKVFVTDRVSSSWLRTGTPYDDHDLGRGIYVDRLSEDAAR